MSPSLAAHSLARLAIDENSIEALLRLPDDLEPARYDVLCEAAILPTGKLARVFCYTLGEPAPRKLLSAVSFAANRATFVPAVREGTRVGVYMTFMVIIDTRLAEPLILAVPNNGVEKARFGLLYAAPQRILDHRAGSEQGSYVSDGRGGRLDRSPTAYLRRDVNMFVWMQFVVDEHGDVQDYRLAKATPASDRAMRFLEKYGQERKFLPGSHDRRTRTMVYAEPFFSLD